MGIPEKLVQIRESRGYTRKRLAEELGRPYTTITKYESGEREPGHSYIIEIAKKFGVTTDYILGIEDNPAKKSVHLTPKAQCIGRAYEKATPPVQRTVEVALEPYMDGQDNIVFVDFPHSDQATSAGTGRFLDEESMHTLRVRLDALPQGYERARDRYFGVPVSGDSMEPSYHDGDILIVSREPVNVSEIGVFTVDGEGYVKKLGRGVLHSLNKAYDDIQLTENVYCNGKVVAILDPAAIEK